MMTDSVTRTTTKDALPVNASFFAADATNPLRRPSLFCRLVGVIEMKILVISFFVVCRRNVGENETEYPNKVHGVGVPGTE